MAWLWADIYYAKRAPLEELVIKSNVSGQVLEALEEAEGNRLGPKAFIVIDSELEALELERLDKKISLQKRLVQLNQKVYQRHLDYYHSIERIAGKSKFEKDNAFYTQVAALEKYISLQNALKDLNQRKDQLQKTISDKSLIYPGWYLYDLYVKKGDVVMPGTPLCKIANTSKAKLTLYLTPEDAKNYKHMQLFINDKPSDKQFAQVWKISDASHISSYEAVLILDRSELFSELVKVELKDVSHP